MNLKIVLLHNLVEVLCTSDAAADVGDGAGDDDGGGDDDIPQTRRTYNCVF